MNIICRINQNFTFIPLVICLCSISVSCVNTPTIEVSQENPIPENFEQEQLTKKYRNPSNTYEEIPVKLIPYSQTISHPRSKISKHQLQIEEANRNNFYKIFRVNEIDITYTCVFNKRGLYISASLDSVNPPGLYSLINSEFERTTWSNLNSNLCRNESSTNLRSVDVSVSIVKK